MPIHPDCSWNVDFLVMVVESAGWTRGRGGAELEPREIRNAGSDQGVGRIG